MHRVSGENSNATERYPFGIEVFSSRFAAPMHVLQDAVHKRLPPPRSGGSDIPCHLAAKPARESGIRSHQKHSLGMSL
jgi:hypothetical protein